MSKEQKHLLVVEDGPGLQSQLKWAFDGYEVTVAGERREAINQLRRLVKEHDSFIPAHVGLGRALREAGRESDAVNAWYDGFEVTGSPIFLIELEDHFLAREQPLAGIEALKRCISRSQKDTLPRFHLGKLYFRLEMLDDALSVLSSLEGRAEYAPSLHYLLGRIHERRQNSAEAMRAYRKVYILKQRGGNQHIEVDLPPAEDVPEQPQLWELPVPPGDAPGQHRPGMAGAR